MVLTRSSDTYRPTGTFTVLGETSVYLVQQHIAGDDSSRRVLLLLPDGFGMARHNFILADSLSQKGWDVIIPDYFEGSLRQPSRERLISC